MDLSERAAIEKSGGNATRHPWELARARFTIACLRRWAPLVGPIIDIGCGDAYVLSQVQAAFPGLDGYGVDTGYQKGGSCPHGLTLCASLDELPVSASPAGVLLLMDVLEHVADPVEMLHDLIRRRLVDSQTIFFVTVPAWQVLFSAHDRWLGHYRRYNTALLQQHLELGGMKVLESGYLFFTLVLIRALEVALAKMGLHSTKTTGLVGWRGGTLLSSMLSRALLWDAALCQKMSLWTGISLPGLSCYAVGQLR